MAHQPIIRIKGARQHNLKNLDIEIPRNRLVIITGMSGSGKSSLAFDTLYAEGQRKYVESLSAYARQFLDQMQKPDVDFIEGLSPAIAIEQRTAAASPRSTIATTTEIYDYLRLLYAAVGLPHDPDTGEPIVRQTPQQITDEILSWEEGARIILLAPLARKEPGELRDVIEKARREGFLRLRIDGEMVELGGKPDSLRLARTRRHDIDAVIDRLLVKKEAQQRLADSVEMALRWGGNVLHVLYQPSSSADWKEHTFSTNYANPKTGFLMPKLTPKHFSFNSHLGACAACHGIGTEIFFDAELMVDNTKTLDEGAIKIWRTGNKKMKEYYSALLESLVQEFKVARNQPFQDLPESFRSVLFYGMGGRREEKAETASPIEENPQVSSSQSLVASSTSVASGRGFEGIVSQAERLFASSESEITKNRLRMFTSRRVCQACKGARLRKEILAVTLESSNHHQLNIHEFCQLTIEKCATWISSIQLDQAQHHIVVDVLREISRRLNFLLQVGLGYLNLNRESGTLSGGEVQRIRLATQIGSGLSGVLYVLDEPSIGLHQRDNDKLIETLRNLRDLGNSVIVVEHDEDTIRASDYILDLGPGAGPRGGRIIAQGPLEEVLKCEESLTAQYLNGRLRIPIPKSRVPPRKDRSLAGEVGDGWITILGARENNLKNVTAAFPVGCFTCVTGVSGSGKSTLVNDILYTALARDINRAKERPGKHSKIIGIEQLDKVIIIDQSPLGRTPRSNPATYSGILGAVRSLFCELPTARIRGYDAGRFSFNIKGGRCEHCQGAGSIRIEMHFLADVYVECEICRGKRYNRETLEITYKGKNIADVLDMNVDEASRFFRNIPAISEKLETLQDVGLGYIHLGQSANTLSGGEAQRIKLAAELSKKSTGRTIYILDEPTTGLHFADIHKLLDVLIKLRDAHNTLVVIEHNLEVIKCADWIVDLGPEGGEAGGYIVAEGTPEEVARNSQSYTGNYLQKILFPKKPTS